MKKAICILILITLLLSGCDMAPSETNWGSFTSEKTFSHDDLYYAVQETEEVDGVPFVNVRIYSADGQLTDSFQPARASDFWGICWEHDTYNIWIQSGDIGVLCYSYEDGKWELDTSAARPDYVVSKYDHAE